ncbi:MAG TPA: hypothetical protein VGJ54_01295, partial [Streptosporangiaceae bacterium]
VGPGKVDTAPKAPPGSLRPASLARSAARPGVLSVPRTRPRAAVPRTPHQPIIPTTWPGR